VLLLLLVLKIWEEESLKKKVEVEVEVEVEIKESIVISEIIVLDGQTIVDYFYLYAFYLFNCSLFFVRLKRL